MEIGMVQLEMSFMEILEAVGNGNETSKGRKAN